MSDKSGDTWKRGIYLALIKLMHFIAVVQYFYAIYYDFVYVNVPSKNKSKFGGKFKYLTYLDAVNTVCFMLQSAMFVFVLSFSLSCAAKLHKQVENIKVNKR